MLQKNSSNRKQTQKKSYMSRLGRGSNRSSKAMGTGGAIRLASRDIKKDFMVMNGDVLTNINLNQFVDFYKKNISQRPALLPPIRRKIPCF